MPGYPRVDKGNDTLLARYDGSVVDALPWQQLPLPADGGVEESGMPLPSWRRLLEVSLDEPHVVQMLAVHVQVPCVLIPAMYRPAAVG